MEIPHIVWLHGLNCTSATFTHLKLQLPPHTETVIDYHSQQCLEDSFEEILLSIPALTPIVIIGHSLGGVIAHLLCTRDIPNLNIQKIITISSPFGGSTAAGILRWFYPGFHVFKDLSTRSKIVKEVCSKEHNIPFLSLVSTSGSLPFIGEDNDGVVTIKSQEAIRATRRVRIKANHFEALQDPTTVEEIRSFAF